jgi:hypothetical protein
MRNPETTTATLTLERACPMDEYPLRGSRGEGFAGSGLPRALFYGAYFLGNSGGKTGACCSGALVASLLQGHSTMI